VIGLVTLPFATVPLLWRRTHPGPVLAVIASAFAVAALFTAREPNGAGLLFGMFAAALYGDRRTRIAAGVLALGGLVVAFATVLATGEAKTLGHRGGLRVRARLGAGRPHQDPTRLSDPARGTGGEAPARAGGTRPAATEEERNRIARELHDVVAHNVSVIAVQAGAARMTSAENPDLANETMGLIERTARSTLAELRTLLGILRRDEGEAPGRRPQPTLANLDALIGRAREAGVRIDVRVEGSLEGLPATADLSAYRIVQEALTNVMKHAPGARVHLLVCRTGGALDLVVVDDGPGAPPDAAGGQGLIGMRERAVLVGGRLTAGPALGGGFRVEAHLPVESSGSARNAPIAEGSLDRARTP